MKQHPLASQLAQVFATVGIAGLALVGCSKPAPQTNAQASSTASTNEPLLAAPMRPPPLRPALTQINQKSSSVPPWVTLVTWSKTQ